MLKWNDIMKKQWKCTGLIQGLPYDIHVGQALYVTICIRVLVVCDRLSFSLVRKEDLSSSCLQLSMHVTKKSMSRDNTVSWSDVGVGPLSQPFQETKKGLHMHAPDYSQSLPQDWPDRWLRAPDQTCKPFNDLNGWKCVQRSSDNGHLSLLRLQIAGVLHMLIWVC